MLLKAKVKKGLFYLPNYLNSKERGELLGYLSQIYPIWEKKAGDKQLLRPVYWLGNWQFASLGYYHPPHRARGRAIAVESFPPILRQMVRDIEFKIRRSFSLREIPRGWALNTCLINFYGCFNQDGKRKDLARLGEHRDFEPGPVASFSLGERALFQFVHSTSRYGKSRVVHQMWLEDNSLQVFGGEYWKDTLLHRVQRVERKHGHLFSNPYPNFEARRINLTFRYVPLQDWVSFEQLTSEKLERIFPYLRTLSQHSAFFQNKLKVLLHSA